MDIIDRIKQYLNHKGISDYRFEKTLSLSKGYINKAKNPTADILMKMCGIYTDISTEWLLRGEGEMLREKREDLGLHRAESRFGILLFILCSIFPIEVRFYVFICYRNLFICCDSICNKEYFYRAFTAALILVS